MTHRQIGIGETSSFRYIGIEPPITDDQADRILKVVAMPSWMPWGLDYHAESASNGTLYTAFSVGVGDALDVHGRKFVDVGAMELARAIGRILEAEGDSVKVFDHIITTDFEHPIFGAEADRERVVLASVRTRHQT